MTVTNDEHDVTEPQARKLRRELFSDELVGQLLARAGERGVSLTGEAGSFPR